MNVPRKPRDIVIFLGAGFSADAGLPTLDKFGKFSDAEYKKLCDENKGGKHAYEMLKEAGRTFKSFKHYCARTLDANTSVGGVRPADNMETLFCIAESMREAQFNPSFGLFPDSPEAVAPSGEPIEVPSEHLLGQIQLWLWQVFNGLPALDPQRAVALEWRELQYERFLRLLNLDGLRTTTTIVTTNYDLVVEYYSWAVEMGVGCSYPLRYHWDYTPLQAADNEPSGGLPIGFTESWQHEPNSLILCKLHGSVNFFESGTAGLGKLGICDDLVSSDEYVGKSYVPVYEPPKGSASMIKGKKLRERPAILALDAIWSLKQRYGQSLAPAIIPPTYAKLQGQPWIRRIWSKAFQAIRDARLILFIGYSLPASDGFMRAMFQGALAARNGNRPEVFLIDPEGEKTKCRYEEVFGPLQASNVERRPAPVKESTFAEAMKDHTIEAILGESLGDL